MRPSYPLGMIPFVSRLPEPSQPDVCGGFGRDRPRYRLYGRGDHHVHRCLDCLRAAAAGELVDRLAAGAERSPDLGARCGR